MAEVDPTLEGADNPDRPEWLPENFDSPEALVSSYKESQRKITETSQRLAEESRARESLEEAVQSLSAQFEAQSRPDPTNVYNQWQQQYEDDPFSTTLSLAQAVAEQTAKSLLQQQSQGQSQPVVTPDVVAFIADQTMTQSHEDWQDYKEKVSERIAQDPLFHRDELWQSPQAAQSALESAYKMVKADDLLSGNSVVQQQQADTRAMKLQSQTLTGATGRPPSPAADAEEWARIKDARPKNYWD